MLRNTSPSSLGLDPYVIEKSKKELGKMEAILGADQTISSLVDDILDHYENNRADLLTGKAMIVAYSRPIAMKIYKRILELRPTWTEKVAVVMTQDVYKRQARACVASGSAAGICGG